MNFFLALTPILLVIVLMLVFRRGSQQAGPAGWLTGLDNQEGLVLRKTLPIGIAICLLLGIVTWLIRTSHPLLAQ